MRQLMLFGVGGVLGFVVDAGIVQALVAGLGWNPYGARLLSFLVAATVTWLFNRRFTFREERHYGLFGEWARWMAAMSGGFAVNYAAYSFCIFHSPTMRALPALAVAVGSLAGFAVNYVASKWWIYRRRG
ncbi:MAG TPA: GtrA family protein [Dokdonella sp.]|uniref:GtrA family protein n=1 Tax=Dokdonella sp. TaxID=2291710 RepID=UPI0025BF1EB7|nr:GtrA family protein [Dokdonella sp.]MBX3692264.1 GtrA family protein [Dokdonella sp.]MCW5567114.1 GtrA family protein [Dokdonella sp.]HNR91878.1 GtrA family protein [Dokdonella sp.]